MEQLRSNALRSFWIAVVVSSRQKSFRCVCFVLVPNTQLNRIHFIPASRWILKFQVVNILALGSSLAPSQALGVQSNVLGIDQKS